MTAGLPDDAITAEAIAAAALVIHRAHCAGSCRHKPLPQSYDWVDARKALAAALPALTAPIAVQATRAERERIRRRLTADAATLRAAGRVASADALQRHADLLGDQQTAGSPDVEAST